MGIKNKNKQDNMVMMVICTKCARSFSLDISYDNFDIDCPRCEKDGPDEFNLGVKLIESLTGVVNETKKENKTKKVIKKKTSKKVIKNENSNTGK